jgi:hypothetical protein
MTHRAYLGRRARDGDRVLRAHENEVIPAAFSPDGARIAIASAEPHGTHLRCRFMFAKNLPALRAP